MSNLSNIFGSDVASKLQPLAARGYTFGVFVDGDEVTLENVYGGLTSNDQMKHFHPASGAGYTHVAGRDFGHDIGKVVTEVLRLENTDVECEPDDDREPTPEEDRKQLASSLASLSEDTFRAYQSAIESAAALRAQRAHGNAATASTN
ncbi:hypothetical protein [Roseiconus lacunae]|uniref:Uncharacterized protein n=1 Tax=Roseiconus lacunae TaxID=2605694 RepID=A0ABT7PMN5_9BACT|nr:hypothetical protein [Roseiconus lacunae]MDM4017772.1 hypothetical protein [Roseiconus lacunae]